VTTNCADALPRVLIVDDEPANVHSLAQALGAGYDLRFATAAEHALQLASMLAFDLILLDVVLPDMDGFEVLRRLKADEATRGVPVIFVTSKNETADEEQGFALGAVDYITKPASAPLVRARVRTHIELKRQRDLLLQRASIDGLTGIANRRRFDDALERRFALAAHGGARLSLLLLDVDHFKRYNDRYGHGAGDECLKRIASMLHATFGETEALVARIGGEEFAVLLAHGELPAQALRLLDGVRTLAIAHADSDTGACVSVSAGALQAAASAFDSPAALLEATDRLLYRAKREGRNRCVYRGANDAEAQTLIAPAG
jgi:diguanylate cyclase (GGDEF)-like protein